jgi:hypothetical protein
MVERRRASKRSSGSLSRYPKSVLASGSEIPNASRAARTSGMLGDPSRRKTAPMPPPTWSAWWSSSTSARCFGVDRGRRGGSPHDHTRWRSSEKRHRLWWTQQTAEIWTARPASGWGLAGLSSVYLEARAATVDLQEWSPRSSLCKHTHQALKHIVHARVDVDVPTVGIPRHDAVADKRRSALVDRWQFRATLVKDLAAENYRDVGRPRALVQLVL